MRKLIGACTGRASGPVEGQDQLLDDVEEADRGDDRRLRIVVQPLQHQPLGDERDGAHDQRAARRWRAGSRAPDAPGTQAREEPGEHRAEHEELAVRDVDDAHDAEDQRQAERGQREHGGADQPFQHGEEEMRAEAHWVALVTP